jgi:hypothetical protein
MWACAEAMECSAVLQSRNHLQMLRYSPCRCQTRQIKKLTCHQLTRRSNSPGQAFQRCCRREAPRRRLPVRAQQLPQDRCLLKGPGVNHLKNIKSRTQLRRDYLNTQADNLEPFHRCSAGPGCKHRAALLWLEAQRAASNAARELKQPPNPAHTDKKDDSCQALIRGRRKAAGAQPMQRRPLALSTAGTGCSTWPMKTNSAENRRQQRYQRVETPPPQNQWQRAQGTETRCSSAIGKKAQESKTVDRHSMTRAHWH